MKKLTLIALIALMLIFPASAEEAAPDIPAAEEAAPAFDAPALKNPEERYAQIIENSDGSESMLFALLDSSNDEAADIEAYGALRIIESLPLDDEGQPLLQTEITIQDSVYGKMLISHTAYGEHETTAYTVGEVTLLVENGKISVGQLYDQADFDYFVTSYHFPYGQLQSLNGTRHDENGYTYMLVRSDDNMSLEFVVSPDDMRIEQLRLYFRDEDGTLCLSGYEDYQAIEAIEVPEQIIEIFADYVEPVPTVTPEASAAPEESGN